MSQIELSSNPIIKSIIWWSMIYTQYVWQCVSTQGSESLKPAGNTCMLSPLWWQVADLNPSVVRHMVAYNSNWTEGEITSSIINHRADDVSASYELLLKQWKRGDTLPKQLTTTDKKVQQMKENLMHSMQRSRTSITAPRRVHLNRQSSKSYEGCTKFRLPRLLSLEAERKGFKEDSETFRKLLQLLSTKHQESITLSKSMDQLEVTPQLSMGGQALKVVTMV